MRQVILTVLGLAILLLGFMGMKKIMGSKKQASRTTEVRKAKVFTEVAHPDDISVRVLLTGRLEAVDKVDIFAEAQGVFRSAQGFRPGMFFKKGEVMITIDNEQDLATLKAQRSTLLSMISRILPDLKFDYPRSALQWEAYIRDFDVQAITPALPPALDEREKFFIAGQNIHTTFYNIKNLEARLSKYKIRAPFSGVLTSTNVYPGALISPGQKLGTLVGQDRFELALPVREEYLPFLSRGQSLELRARDLNTPMTGTLVRTNPIIDPATQSFTAYISVRAEGLKEGMFFEAWLPLKPFENALEVDRRLLISNQYVFVVDSERLEQVEVQPLHYNEETVVIRGLKDGQRLMTKMLPGAREGMEVEIIQ